MAEKKKYIKDAIVWCNGRWLRGQDFVLCDDGIYRTPYAINTIYRDVFPYEDWMEEYLGSDKDFRLEDRWQN